MRLALALALASLCSCGGKTCTVTISGAQTGIAGLLEGTYDCGFTNTQFQTASNTGSFSFGAPTVSENAPISVGIGWPGEPRPGHYQSSDPSANGDVSVIYSGGTFAEQWDAMANCTSSCTTLGSYDLNLSEVSTLVTFTSFKRYEAHGTLDATLVESHTPPVVLTVHASF
jgi:hypothetical protein